MAIWGTRLVFLLLNFFTLAYMYMYYLVLPVECRSYKFGSFLCPVRNCPRAYSACVFILSTHRINHENTEVDLEFLLLFVQKKVRPFQFLISSNYLQMHSPFAVDPH